MVLWIDKIGSIIGYLEFKKLNSKENDQKEGENIGKG